MKTKFKTLLIMLTLGLMLLIISCSSSNDKPTGPPLTKIGDKIDFDAYQWRVLDVQGNYALILSDHIIEKRQYHTTREDIVLAYCTLREYLNDEFYNSFSAENRARILEVYTPNWDNPSEETPGGPATNDKIFLLSYAEVLQYLPTQLERIATYEGPLDVWWWWLRSPGSHTDFAGVVDANGKVSFIGAYVSNINGSVRPAMWIAL